MPAKRCPKVILEGTRLTLKTEVVFALNEHPRILGPRKYRYHSPLISAEDKSFEQARAERLKVSGNPGQYDDLERFMIEQKQFVQLTGESNLPILKVDISDNNIDRVVE